MKRFISIAAQHVVLSPLSVLMALTIAFEKAIAAIEWAAKGRAWTVYLVAVSIRIEIWAER